MVEDHQEDKMMTNINKDGVDMAYTSPYNDDDMDVDKLVVMDVVYY